MREIIEQTGARKYMPSLNVNRIASAWDALMSKGVGFAYGIVNELTGDPDGFLLAVHSENLLSGERTACEMLFLVATDARKQGTAKKLLAEFEAGAREDGCLSAVCGCHTINSVETPEKLERWYRLNGYSFVSTAVQKSLK